MADERNYEVGYGKPPKASRFPPGQSGNQNGRPKGARGVRSQVAEVLTAQVVVKIAGRSKAVPAINAVLLRLRQKALEGDIRAIRQCIELGMLHLPEEVNQAAKSLGDADQQIFDAYFRLRETPSDAPPHDSSDQQTGENEDA